MIGMTRMDAAMKLTGEGFAVLPIRPGDKAPMNAHGVSEATTDADTVCRWFTNHPTANIGIAAGKSELLIVDLDPPAGEDSWRELAARHGGAPSTLSVVTPRGGMHHYYAAPSGVDLRPSAGKLGDGVDIRAGESYVVAPPSMNGNGKGWTVDDPTIELPTRSAIAPAPQWLVDLCKSPAPKPAPSSMATGTVAEGSRNDTLTRHAGALRRQGLDADAIAAALHGINAAKCSPPLPGDEVDAIAVSVGRYEPREDARCVVKLTADEHLAIEAAVDVLAGDPGIFQRGGALVRVVRGDCSDGIMRAATTPAIRSAPSANIRERLTRLSRFTRYDARADDEVQTHPPGWLVAGIEARGEWPNIRPLIGVSDTPVLRADGSVHQTPGYDRATGILYAPTDGTDLPLIGDDLICDDAQAAADDLLELVTDFPFAETCHRSAWLAAALTPFARPAYKGATPGFVFDANVRGSGKTLIAQLIGGIATSRGVATSGYAHDDDEMRKRITSLAIAGDPIILLDNVDGPFGNASLDRALTGDRWGDRILGKSEEVDLPWRTIILATGNNIAIAADTARRLIHVRLDVLDEHPEHRSGFRFPDLLRHVAEQRERYIAASLTVLSAYIRAGSPRHDLRPFGSFEGWAGLVREAIVWCGLVDPVESQERLAATSDSTADSLAQLIAAWAEFDTSGHGFTAADLAHTLYTAPVPNDPAAVTMRAALELLTEVPPGKTPSPRQIGNRLRRIKRRVMRGRYMDSRESSDRRQVWFVQEAV